MMERAAVLVAFAFLASLVVWAVRRWTVRASARKRGGLATRLWAALGEEPDARTAIVAFSTPSCAACHTAQLPALRAAEERLGAAAIRIVRVDAASRPEVARAFGVMTVPSTVVLAASGTVVAANHGFASADRLATQASAALAAR